MYHRKIPDAVRWFSLTATRSDGPLPELTKTERKKHLSFKISPPTFSTFSIITSLAVSGTLSRGFQIWLGSQSPTPKASSVFAILRFRLFAHLPICNTGMQGCGQALLKKEGDIFLSQKQQHIPYPIDLKALCYVLPVTCYVLPVTCYPELSGIKKAPHIAVKGFQRRRRPTLPLA